MGKLYSVKELIFLDYSKISCIYSVTSSCGPSSSYSSVHQFWLESVSFHVAITVLFFRR